MFDDRGVVQRRNDRSGPLQQQATKRVWVDLAVVFPHRSRHPARARPDGVDVSSRVPGDLLWWTRTTTGEWAGWCCVQIATAGEVRHVWQYVTAAALSPRDDVT